LLQEEEAEEVSERVSPAGNGGGGNLNGASWKWWNCRRNSRGFCNYQWFKWCSGPHSTVGEVVLEECSEAEAEELLQGVIL
jgi:hypothetical protein